MKKDSKIYVAGHQGLVGSAIVRRLESTGYTNIIRRTHNELDLLDQKAVSNFFTTEKPEYVFLAAAKVGGIMANQNFPADFIYQNVQIQNNIIYSAHVNKITKLLFLGSSCIYPKLAPQPMKEEYLLTGKLEPTNEPYAIAKIAGLKMCASYKRQYGDNFISVMPTNLYGINDNFHPEHSHVLPALIRRFHEAKVQGNKEVAAWGTGSPRREFLYVDDMADASIHLMNTYDGQETVNIGTGEDITIKELTELVAKTVGYQGKIKWDTDRPDGTARKLLDVSRLHSLGFKHSTSLEEGLRKTYSWYIKKTL